MYGRRHARIVKFLLVLLAATTARGGDEAWPRFRGPTGFGYTRERHLPHTWGGKNNTNVVWKTPLVGEGHASPIVAENRVFVCTVHWPSTVKDRKKVIPEHHVLCYDAQKGTLLWDTQVSPGPWLRTDFRSSPGGGYACPTPATDGKLVFCVFGSSVVAAIDYRGTIRWRKEITPFTFDVTIGSSPVLERDTLFLLCSMARKEDSCLLAYDKKTGAVRWRQPMTATGFGHSTPVFIEVQGKRQLLCLASGGGEAPQALQAFDPADGKRLWWCWGGGDAASPAYGSGLVYFDSGRGGTGVAVDPSGSGDLTKTHTRWTKDALSEGIGSPIIVGDLVFRLLSPDRLHCWQLSDGREVFAKRLDGISTTWASPIADPEGVIFYANAGTSFVVRAGRTFTVLAVNDLGDPNHASPAVARGKLYLVGTKNVFCVGRR